MYLINVPILGKRPGDIILEGDKYYDSFDVWAKNGDLKGGVIICQPHTPKEDRIVDDLDKKKDSHSKEKDGIADDKENSEKDLHDAPPGSLSDNNVNSNNVESVQKSSKKSGKKVSIKSKYKK